MKTSGFYHVGKSMSVVICFLAFRQVVTYRILTALLIAGRSNMNYFDPIHLELARKGHTITVITPTPGLVKHENIQEYPTMDFEHQVQGMMSTKNFFEMRLSGDRMGTPFATMSEKFSRDCDAFYELPVVQKIIQQGQGHYDLVMTMAFMNECVFGLVGHLNSSFVIVSTVSTVPWFVAATGTPTPLSVVPHVYYDGDQEMSFMERVGNMFTFAYQMITRNWIYLPAMEQAYRKYIPNALGVMEVKNNVSLILGAGHPSFGPLRPSMPDLIDDIGGIHCRPAKQLPKEILDMITDQAGQAKEFVFFSLGSIVKGHQVPDRVRRAFLQTFAKFPEFRFLWKWESNFTKEALPDNVRVSKWFPQQDLLGHSKCRLFITHGGLSSLHESIYHASPVLGIPFFGDQDWNMKQVEYHKIGMKLELADINEEHLTHLLNQMLLEKSQYRERALHLSELFRDRQISALDRAVWNIEYVLRHGGATHLRSPARNMSLVQYYCVDVLIFLLAVILILPLLTLCCGYKCYDRRRSTAGIVSPKSPKRNRSKSKNL